MRIGLVLDHFDPGRGGVEQWTSQLAHGLQEGGHEVHAVADGRAAFVTSVAYGSADGLLSVECNTGNPGAVRTADGRLWFPTMKGFAVIDPNNIRTNEVPPPVVLERLLVDYEPVPLAEDLRLPPGTRGLAFEYAGLSFVAPEKVHFKYRLEGYDHDWVDAGLSQGF